MAHLVQRLDPGVGRFLGGLGVGLAGFGAGHQAGEVFAGVDLALDA